MFFSLTKAKKMIIENQFWVLAFLVLFVFSICVPITGDDFTFLAFKESIKGFGGLVDAGVYMYGHLNGRILGNMLSLVLIDQPFLSALFRALVLIAIIYLAIRIVRPRHVVTRNILVILLFSIPTFIFAQTYAWRAGFYNYVVPVMFVLMFVTMFIDIYKNPRLTKMKTLSLMVLSFLGGLFVENITLVLVLFSVASIAYVVSSRDARKYTPAIVAFTVGSFASALLMFNSPIYQNVSSGEDTYRSIGGAGAAGNSDGLVGNISENTVSIIDLLLTNNILLVVAISSISIWIILAKRSVLFNKYKNRHVVLLSLLAFYPVYLYIKPNMTNLDTFTFKFQLLFAFMHLILAVMYILGVIYCIYTNVTDKQSRNTSIVLLITAVTLVAPFLIITPFGGRNFYLSYVLIVISMAIVAMNTLNVKTSFLRQLTTPSYVLVGLVGLLYVGIFGSIKIIDIKNNEIIQQNKHMNGVTIKLRKYPFAKFLHDPNNVVKTQKYLADCSCMYTLCSDCRTTVKVEYK